MPKISLLKALREVLSSEHDVPNKKAIDKQQQVALDKIISNYKPLVDSDSRYEYYVFYQTASKLPVDKEVFEEFVSLLPGFRKEFQRMFNFGYTGYFLSGLINNINEEVPIELTVSSYDLYGLGAYLNSRNLEIKFNVGSLLGDGMKSGKIVVHGSGGSLVGRNMKGGTILIRSVCDHAGERMEGGVLTIKGSGGDYVGQRMAGGTIFVDSASNYLGEFMFDGKIYVKKNAGKNVGFEMADGLIEIGEDMEHKVGFGMTGGKIKVHGNVQTTVGLLMDGGEIEIGGNVGPAKIGPAYIGANMTDGKIIIHGYANAVVGCGITGGEIHLNGGYESIADNIGGQAKIFDRGKLIFPK